MRLKADSPHRPGLMKARAALEENRAASREVKYSELSKAVETSPPVPNFERMVDVEPIPNIP